MGSLLVRPIVIPDYSITPRVERKSSVPFLIRSVEIDISNNTRNITLKNPRIYLDCGCRSVPPRPELSPGAADIIRFLESYPYWGVAGVLVYEAESFTLAIHFSNPIDYKKYSMDLSLELSPGNAHLGSLEDTYARMAKGTGSSSHLGIKFDRAVVVATNHRIAQLSHGPIKVTATMCSAEKSCVKVVLEEEEGLQEEAEIGNLCRGRPN